MTGYLFVYGTLLPNARGELGTAERAHLAASGHYLGDATVPGALFNLGGYPGLTQLDGTQGRVHGGVYELRTPDATFAWLDDYEGLTPAEQASGEYERRTLTATFRDGTTVTAWAYIFVQPPEGFSALPSGRWEQ